MDFNYLPLGTKERSTYERIESELDKLTKELDPINMDKEQLADFCRRFESAMKAKKFLIEMIAEEYNIPSEKVIVITEGKLFYRCSRSCSHDEVNREVIAKSKEDLGDGKIGLDSVEETVVEQ